MSGAGIGMASGGGAGCRRRHGVEEAGAGPGWAHTAAYCPRGAAAEGKSRSGKGMEDRHRMQGVGGQVAVGSRDKGAGIGMGARGVGAGGRQ